MPFNNAATSLTLRAIGPSASRVNETGIVPERPISPAVGFNPTTPQSEDGITIEPYVSSPTAPAAKLAATAAAEPELESPVPKFNAYGLRPMPARALHPPRLGNPRNAFHSDRFAFPSRIAPATRRRVATPASLGTIEPTSASEPAV